MDEPLFSMAESALEQQNVLPGPDEISYYVLEKDRKIYMETEVNEEVLRIQRMILRWNMEDKGKPAEERKPIWLYLMSWGGDISYMWTLIDTIEASTTPVYTVNMNMCGSAAALLFLAGSKRFMMKNAKVIFHEGSASVSGDAVKVLDATKSYDQELKRMKNYIVEHTQIPRATVNKKKYNDWEIDAEYCLKNGVCNTIVNSLDEVI